jgi:hypothetical protein
MSPEAFSRGLPRVAISRARLGPDRGATALGGAALGGSPPMGRSKATEQFGSAVGEIKP